MAMSPVLGTLGRALLRGKLGKAFHDLHPHLHSHWDLLIVYLTDGLYLTGGRL